MDAHDLIKFLSLTILLIGGCIVLLLPAMMADKRVIIGYQPTGVPPKMRPPKGGTGESK